MKTSPAEKNDQPWCDFGIQSGRLRVRVVPRANRTEIVGVVNGMLKVRLCAPPDDNRANEALVELLAATVGCPRRAIIIRSGLRSRTKTVEILGARRETIARLFCQKPSEA